MNLYSLCYYYKISILVKQWVICILLQILIENSSFLLLYPLTTNLLHGQYSATESYRNIKFVHMQTHKKQRLFL